jgi:hypothetical protein
MTNLPSMPNDQEVFGLSPGEFRFHEACHFLERFRDAYGPHSPLGNRFLWVISSDAFVMAIASIREMDYGIYKNKLANCEVFRFVQVMRNLTAHHFVVTSPGASFINRDINVHAGTPSGDAISWEEPKLVQSTVIAALDQYESALKDRGIYNREKPNIDAARNWAAQNLVEPTTLLDLFERVLSEVASLCGFGLKSPGSG